MVQSGFKTAHFLHVRIAVAETATLNVRLEIGAVSEQITVQGGAGQLQTESGTRARDGRRTNTNATTRHTELLPNYCPQSRRRCGSHRCGALGPGFSGPQGPGLVSNGGTIMDNNFQMNGVGINDLQSGGQFTGGIAIPNPDTIQDFKV